LIEKGNVVTFEEVLKNVEERDYIDTHRDNSHWYWRKTLLRLTIRTSREEQFQIVLELVHEVTKTE
jgi:cytidylate kinase